ncbi:hypothetical protein WJX81_004179 [Elliptochloris bilobata]|uniref:SGNH hydrolase-type esterase domain-containing protein n=1 Tax=Elliptochloris bilobata TaxID=381761 RepID=A0AAW1RGP8_9CHLO
MLGGLVEIGAELRSKNEAYYAHICQWINETFPVKPGAGSHVFHNAARSATGSPYFASCLQDQVTDQNVDLVFVQFDVNDGHKAPYMNNGHRRSLEVLLEQHRAAWYMADLVIGLLQNNAAAATLFPAGEADAAASAAVLPEPMLPGNWDVATGVCLHDELLHAATLPGDQSGFAWVDDTTSYGTHRWGWVSEHIGAFMDLQVDTSMPGMPAERGAWLSVAVLMSYQRMGTAMLECMRNCECKAMRIDALWKHHMCIKEHGHIKVTPSTECVVRFTNVAPERAGGNRFKLEAATVRPGSYYMGEGLYHFGSERYAENGPPMTQERV